MNSLIVRIRTFWYKIKYQFVLRKAKFGKHTRISCKLKIVGPGKVRVGKGCLFQSDPWGGDYVTLFTHQKSALIDIGNHVILRATRFGSHLGIKVEDYAVIENASVYDSDFHNLDATKRDIDFNKGDRQVTLRNRAYVGVESLCSKGTLLGQGAILLPASGIGTKAVPDHAIIGGLPARIIASVHPTGNH